MPKSQESRKTGVFRKLGYAFAIVINLALIYVFGRLIPSLNLSFLTADYSRVLWAIYLSLGATVAGNIFFIINDSRGLHHLVQMVLNIFAFVAAFTIFTVYPFAFAEVLWATAVTIALIVAMAGTGIAFIVEFVKLLRNKD